MASTSKPGALVASYAENYNDSTPIQVLNREVYEAKIIDGWLVIDIENTFYSSKMMNLIIELRFTNNTGMLTKSYLESFSVGSVAYDYGDGEYYDSTATFLYARTHNLKIEYASEIVFEGAPSITNAYPFNTDVGEPGIFQLMYNKSLVPETGLIDRLLFGANELDDRTVFEGLRVRLVETPHEGALNYTDFSLNYGGVTPTTVLDEDRYIVTNLAGAAVLDIDDVFVYTGEHNLLIEIEWDALVEGGLNIYRTEFAGGYRAYNLTTGSNYAGSDERTYDLQLQFVHDASKIPYEGSALVNNTTYYWRVRVMDTAGVWSDWIAQSFTYAVLTTAPEWSNLVFDPDPGVTGSESIVSIDVTYMLDVETVLFEIDGTNNSMTADGSAYSYSWTPTESGNFTYTIYMESSIGTWSNTTGVYEVEAAPIIPGLPFDTQTLLLIIVGVAVIIIIVLLLRRRK
jgi:hypothetical protein